MRFLGSLLVAIGICVAAPACIIVDEHDHHHYPPVYCDYECDGDFVVWLCDDGYQEDVDDCYALCDGTCAYFENGPACACP